MFFILNGYNDYFGFFPVKFVVWNFLWVSVSVFVVYLLGKFFYKQNEKAIVFGFFVSAFLIFFGSVFDTWKLITNVHFLTSYYFVTLFFLLLIGLFSFFLKSHKKGFLRLFTYLNILFFVLLLFEVSRFAVKTIKTNPDDLLIDSRFTALKSFETTEKKDDSLKPDIFLLIFDAMPSSKALKQDIQFSNSELDSFLLQQGFFIAKEAKSNYEFTVLSVSSMLNMDYVSLNDLKKGNGINMYYRSTASLLDNSLIRVLKNENYHIYQFQPLSIFNNTDWNGNLVFGNMLHMNYFYKTLPGRLYRDLAWNFQRLEVFAKRAYEIEGVKKKADILKTDKLIRNVCTITDSPKFVYAHYILPHVPFYFKPDGTIRSYQNNKRPSISEKVQMTDQVMYTNQKIIEIVSYIKENNKSNTVIVVMGDHGFKSLQKNQNPDFGFQNLNAVYFRDNNYSSLYSSISPVNTFRIILNKYFSAKLSMLKDSCVFYELSRVDWDQ